MILILNSISDCHFRILYRVILFFVFACFVQEWYFNPLNNSSYNVVRYSLIIISNIYIHIIFSIQLYMYYVQTVINNTLEFPKNHKITKCPTVFLKVQYPRTSFFFNYQQEPFFDLATVLKPITLLLLGHYKHDDVIFMVTN